MKKTLIISLVLIFTVCVGLFSTSYATETSKPEMQPLQIIQQDNTNKKYGELEKKVQSEEELDLSDILPKKPEKKEPSILDIFNALIIVIGLILLTGWVYAKVKKINPENLLKGKFDKINENQFKIISSLELGGGKSVYLIEINDKQFIIGATQTSVNLISEIEKKDKNSETNLTKLIKESENDKKS